SKRGDNMRTMFKEKRKQLGWTQKELAEIVELAEVTIRKLESGDRDPSISTALRISRALNEKVENVFPDIFLVNDDTKCIELDKLTKVGG
ncbi:TPA: helix-turn-helix transcriptional regulator, partial [Listeria monocytogenes]